MKKQDRNQVQRGIKIIKQCLHLCKQHPPPPFTGLHSILCEEENRIQGDAFIEH